MSEWYGVLPNNWQDRYLSQMCNEQCDKNIGNQEDNVLSLSYGQIIRKKNKYGGLAPADFATYQIVEPGNIILRLTDLQNDHTSLRTGLVRERGIITSAYCCLKPWESAEYLHYLLHAYDTQKYFYGLGGGVRQSIWFKDIRYIHLPLPPRLEQDQIVRYLDWKVSQVNRLINVKKKQIGLLQEQKRGVINEALPQEGKPIRFRGLFALVKGLNITKANLTETGIPCVSYGQIHSKYGFEVNPDIHQLPFVSEIYLKSNPKSLLHFGDFVFADTSEDIAGSGNFTYLNSKTPVFAGYHTIIARPLKPMNYRYIAYYFDSPRFRSQIQQQVNGVKVYSITRSILNATTIELPSVTEQSTVVEYLDKHYSYFTELIAKISKEINLLHEYRTRLISDVVTGKLDVRDVAVPEFDAVEEAAAEEDVHDENELTDIEEE